MRGWRMLAVLLVLLLPASTSFAAGFRLPEAGAKAMGMGFAFTAQADDPSAIYFNPAGLTQLEGNNVMFGVTYVRENGAEYSGTTPVDDVSAQKSETQKSLNFYIPNAYFTQTSKDGWFAWGVGIFSPFGLGQEYNNPDTSIFRNQVTKIEIQTIVVNPTVAFKINEIFSVGAGIDFMWAQAKLKRTPWDPRLIVDGPSRKAPAPVVAGNAYNLDLKGDGTAWGYNFGVLVKPSPNFRIGANYRSPFTLEIKDGDVNLGNINPAIQPFFGGSSYSTSANATIRMPATFAIGAAYTMGRLTVEADGDWTFWHSYSSLPITFKDPVNSPLGYLLPPTSNAQKNWVDVVAFRLGLEYKVTDPLALRAGFVYDPTPVPAATMGPELPDATRLNYMVGAGYKFSRWTLDGAFMYIDSKNRTVNNQNNATLTGFDGTWNRDAWLLGLDIGYKF